MSTSGKAADSDLWDGLHIPATTGNASKVLALNSTATAFEFVTAASSQVQYVYRSLEGSVYETTFLYWVAPATCTIAETKMHLGTNPTASGSYCKVQIMKNGLLETNSIFTSDSPMQITELTSATNSIYTASGTLDSGQTTLAAGDVIQFRVNQADIGSSDLTVQMKVTY